MNKEIVLIGIIGLLLGGIGGYALSTYSGSSSKHSCGMSEGKCSMGGKHNMGDESQMDGVSMGMGGMNHDMSSMLVSNEKEFIEGMIPHHQEAVDTAKEVLERGATTPDIKKLVEGIITAQEKEIASMKEWYKTWYGKSYTDTGSYIPMMRELETLQGKELDKVFLEDMIHHHMGAIMMAQSIQSTIEHDEMVSLTQAIVASQSQEIGEMRNLLKKI